MYSNKEKEAKGKWFEGKVETIKGEIESTSNNTITVNGKAITMTPDTRYKVPGVKDAGLADLKIGMQVAVLADKKADGKLYARQIVVIPGKTEVRHRVGEVVIYTPSTNTTDGSITIKDKQGATTIFKIVSGNFTIQPSGTTLKVGDWVTVISRRYPAQDQPVAFGVVVHQQKPALGFQQVIGVIHINTANHTITVDMTPPTTFNYDNVTLFVLRSMPTADGQNATIFYREQDSTNLAKLVLVGTSDIPKLKEFLDGLRPENTED